MGGIVSMRSLCAPRLLPIALAGIVSLGFARAGLSVDSSEVRSGRPAASRSTGETAATSALALPRITSPAAPAARAYPVRFAQLPLAFERNLGQSDPRVLYQARGSGYTVFLTSDGAVLGLNGGGPGKRGPQKTPDESATNGAGRAVIRLHFVGASLSPQVSGDDELRAKTNYFIGGDPAKWTTGVPNYARVNFNEVYPGIGLVYYGTGRQLEQDWVVAPGADPAQIAFDVTGASQISIDKNGDLCLAVLEGQLRLQKPTVYQLGSAAGEVGQRIPVEGSFVLAKPNRVSFRLGVYDPTKSLVIDPAVSPPTITASTYLGGSDFDEARALALDTMGDLYVAGDTQSTDFPVSGALYPTCKPDNTGQCARAGFVAEFDPTGTKLQFSTYFGGSGSQYALGLALDGNGDPYVTGQTTSTDFPTTPSAYQSACAVSNGVCFDAFVLKLKSDGSALLYSTYLGGTNTDSAYAITVDPSGDAYVAGETASANFPVTSGALQPTCGSDGNCNPVGGVSQADAFVAKINPALSGASSLVYSTYLGGGGVDYATAIALDSSLNAYVTGSTNSTDLKTTPGIVQPSCKLGETSSTCQGEPFVAKINPSASGSSGLIYLTYLGGSGTGGSQWGQDTGNAIAVDSSGNAYVAGQTSSVDFPVTAGAFQAACASCPTAPDAFAFKLNGTASSLLYSTFLGGTAADFATALSLDQSGDLYVTGGTYSGGSVPSCAGPYSGGSFPTCDGPPASSLPPNFTLGGEDVIVTGVNSLGTGLITSFLLGGTANDVGYGVSRDTADDLYLVGETQSPNFPAVSAFQPDCGGKPTPECPNGDAFMTQLGHMTAPFNSLSVSNLSFGDETVGSSSKSQTLSVLNSGNEALAVTTVTLGGTNPGDFPETNTCTNVTLQPGQSCAVTVTFTPTAPGSRSATVTVNSNAVNGNPTATLNGTGINTAITLAPASLTFGAQIKGTTSPAQPVSLTNTGSAALTLSSLAISGDFGETNTCGGMVAAGATCSINVTFTPSAIGTRTGSLTITDSATGSPQSITLSGTGTAATLTFAPSSLTLPSQFLATTSTAMTVTVTANGSVAFTSIAVTGVNSSDFAATNTCGSALAFGKSCSVSVTFTPTALGTRTAAVTLTDDATGSPQTVNLTGAGVSSSALVTPSALNFGGQFVGTTSSSQTVTVTNTGSTPLTVSGVTISGANATNFSETDMCGSSLAADTSCTIGVTFTPSAVGARAATLTVTNSASTQSVSLSGTGEAPAVTLTPGSLTFPTQVLRTSSAAKTVTLKNSGTATLGITSIGITGSSSKNFTETNTCGSSLAAGLSCTISVVFAPVSGGAITADLSVSDDAAGSPQTVALGGSGGDFSIAVTPASGVSVSQGQQATYTVTLTPVGGFSQTLAVTCTNAPQLSTCSLSSNSVTLNGTSPSTLTMNVSTTAPGATAPGVRTRPRPPLRAPGSPFSWLAALGLALMVWSARRRRPALILAVAVISIMMSASCGGGSSLISSSTPGTPFGTYSVSVSASYAGLSHSTTASLTVQ